jgi:hypothetical protein
MKGMCEKAEARFQIGDRRVVTDDVEVEGSGSVHYRRLYSKRCVITNTRLLYKIRGSTLSRIAPSMAEVSEYMRRAKTTGCSLAKAGGEGGW